MKRALMAATASSGKLSSRWRTFKFRRRFFQLPRRIEGLSMLFAALPRFVKFIRMCSFKFRNLAKVKPHKKVKEQNRNSAYSQQPLVDANTCDRQLTTRRRSRPAEESVFPSSLRKLSSSERALVISVAKEHKWEKVLLLPNNEGVQGQDLFKLVEGQWLNSDLVNTYFSLLKLRCERFANWLQAGFENLDHDLTNHSHQPSHLNAFFFTSFWYTKYLQSGYTGVRCWTRDIDLRTYDCLFFPVNLDNLHWVLVVAYSDSRVVEYYNSMSSACFGAVTTTVIKYLNEVGLQNNWILSKSKQWKPVDKSNGIPKQVDSNSCGVYMCVFADLLSKGVRPPFRFSSKDIASIRLGMAADFLKGFIN